MCLTVEKDLTALAERPSSLLMYFSDSEDHIFLFSLHRISVNYTRDLHHRLQRRPLSAANRVSRKPDPARSSGNLRSALRPPAAVPASLLPSSESQIVEKLSSARQSPPTHGHHQD